jgi:hypothetical protein
VHSLVDGMCAAVGLLWQTGLSRSAPEGLAVGFRLPKRLHPPGQPQDQESQPERRSHVERQQGRFEQRRRHGRSSARRLGVWPHSEGLRRPISK